MKEIAEKLQEIPESRRQLVFRLSDLYFGLSNVKAQEYLMQGACRRVDYVTRCAENVFHIFPIDQTEQLARDDLLDLAINLHAFFINISGLFDNLAWVFVSEHELQGESKDGKLGRYEVGLFNRNTQAHLPDALRTFLQSENLRKWYSEYSKNYRDALAHRIPLYVPPSFLTGEALKKYQELEAESQALDLTKIEDSEKFDDILAQQRQLGPACPIFAHSFNEGSRSVYLHAQVIADYSTIKEVIETFCENFEPKAQ